MRWRRWQLESWLPEERWCELGGGRDGGRERREGDEEEEKEERQEIRRQDMDAAITEFYTIIERRQ